MQCGGKSPEALKADLNEKLHSQAIFAGSSQLLREGDKDRQQWKYSASKRKTKVEKITSSFTHTHTYTPPSGHKNSY